MEYVACNLCGADRAEPYARVGNSSVVRCLDCGLFYTNPRPAAEDVAKIYSEDYFVSRNPSVLGYDDYATHADGLKKVFADHMKKIEKFVQPPAALIDVGCAYGYFLEIAVSHGWHAEGSEVSPFASLRAREAAGVPVHTGALSGLELTPCSYEVVTMWDMLEHSFDPVGELTQANRILKPDGYLFLTVPNAGSFMARIMRRHWYGFKKIAEHNYFFSVNTLGRMLAKTGFEMLESSRGVWPCSMRFLVTKINPYSPTVANLAGKVVRWLGVQNTIIKFRFIDMFVVARKAGNPSQRHIVAS